MSVISERQFGAAPVNLSHGGRDGEAAARAAQKDNGGAPLDRHISRPGSRPPNERKSVAKDNGGAPSDRYPSPSSGTMQRAGTLWSRG